MSKKQIIKKHEECVRFGDLIDGKAIKKRNEIGYKDTDDGFICNSCALERIIDDCDLLKYSAIKSFDELKDALTLLKNGFKKISNILERYGRV